MSVRRYGVRQENRSKGDSEDSTDSEDEGDRDPRKTLDSAYAVTYRDQMLDPWSGRLCGICGPDSTETEWASGTRCAAASAC